MHECVCMSVCACISVCMLSGYHNVMKDCGFFSVDHEFRMMHQWHSSLVVKHVFFE